MFKFLASIFSLVVLMSPLSQAQCDGYKPSMFPPPGPLPECEAGWDYDCLARCTWDYKLAMVDAYTLYCVRMSMAYENWLYRNQLCVEAYDACIQAGTNPSICQSNVDKCLSDASADRLKAETSAQNELDSSINQAIHNFWECIEGCCPHINP